MPPKELQGRNGTLEFAHRAMKNLRFILDARDEDVHPITQTITTLLAVLVFPWERHALVRLKKRRLSDLSADGWPHWRMSGLRVETNRVQTIGELTVLIRNSVSHGHVTFSSDSRTLPDVVVMFANHPFGSPTADWMAAIRADELALFCEKFLELLFEAVR